MVDWQQVAIDFVLGAVPPAELPAIAEGDLRSPDQPEAMFELAFSARFVILAIRLLRC